MRIVLMFWALACAGAGAQQTVPLASQMTCQDAINSVALHGKVTMMTDAHAYETYVYDPSDCGRNEVATPAMIETCDSDYCDVGYTCVLQVQY